MNRTNKLSGVLLPLFTFALISACGGGGGGGTSLGGPSDLDYGPATQALTRSIASTPTSPTFTGTADAFAITAGSLPTGLSIDASTGTISGTPTEVQTASLLTITASLTGGSSDTFDLTFTVNTGNSHSLYATNETGGLIGIYSIDPATGKLNMRGDVSGLDSPQGMALTHDLKYLYTANTNTGLINGFTVEANTGDLVELAGSPFPMVGGGALFPVALTVSPDGGTLYVADRIGNGISIFTIAANGSLTETAGSPFGSYQNANDLAFASLPSGDFLYLVATGATPNGLITFSIAPNGTLTEVDADATGTSPVAIAAALTGDFIYVANQGNSSVSAYSTATDGTLTELAGSPTAIAGAAGTLSDILLSDDGTTRTLYTTSTNGLISQFAVAQDGSLSLLTPDSVASPGTQLFGLAAGPEGSRIYASDTSINEIRSFTVGGTGAITPLLDLPRVRTPGPTANVLILPSAAAPAWSTNNLFGANSTSGAISTFDVDGTGAMTAQIPLDTSASNTIRKIAIHGNGQTLYLAQASDATAPLLNVPLLSDGSPDITNSVATAGNDADLIAIDHNSDFLYVVDASVPSLFPYPLALDGTIGAAGASLPTGSLPIDVVIDPTGRFAYVLNLTDNTISQFTVDSDTGALSATNPATVSVALTPRAMAFHPSGRYAYVVSSGGTGLGGDLVSQFSVNPITGVLTPMVTPQVSTGIDSFAIAASPDGRYVVVANPGDDTVMTFQVNTLNSNGVENGNLVGPIDTVTTASQPQTLAIGKNSTTVYVGTNTGSNVEAYAIDSSGMLTSLDIETTAGPIRALALRESRQ